MARDRTERRKKSASGIGRFLALPHSVIDSPAYRALPHPARSLLVDVARQFSGRNNGALVATPRYLQPLGWKSHDTVARALRQLLDARLLVETRKGRFPNTPAWYALGWLVLDIRDGLDIDPSTYRKDAYSGAPLIPSHGARTMPVAPSHGERAPTLTPPHGAIRPQIDPALAPSHGKYLHQAICTARSAGVSS